jgi:hypothetical protein
MKSVEKESGKNKQQDSKPKTENHQTQDVKPKTLDPRPKTFEPSGPDFLFVSRFGSPVSSVATSIEPGFNS